MLSHSRPYPLAASAVLLLFLVLASGCATWHSIGKESPEHFFARKSPGAARLSLTESTLVLSRPVFVNGTIRGTARGSDTGQQVTVPVSEVRTIEVRSFKGSPAAKVTAGFFSAVVLLAIVGAALSNHRTNP